MKASVLEGLQKIRQEFSPHNEDYWLLAPADMPLLRVTAVNAVLKAIGDACESLESRAKCETNPTIDLTTSPKLPIVIPEFRGKRGHPAAFPWAAAEQATKLSENQGLNALLDQYPVRQVDLSEDGVLIDIDTPRILKNLRSDPKNPRMINIRIRVSSGQLKLQSSGQVFLETSGRQSSEAKATPSIGCNHGSCLHST